MGKEVVTAGLDLAKNVFQVQAIDINGEVLIRRKLWRAEASRLFADLPPCLVGIKACASAHHWARELIALGHQVRLMPRAYLKPYLKRGKTDAADAEATCEAVTRPTMRFVAVKTVEQRAVLIHHNKRELLVRQQTMLIKALRGHLPSRIRSAGLKPATTTRSMHKGQSEHRFKPETTQLFLPSHTNQGNSEFFNGLLNEMILRISCK